MPIVGERGDVTTLPGRDDGPPTSEEEVEHRVGVEKIGPATDELPTPDGDDVHNLKTVEQRLHFVGGQADAARHGHWLFDDTEFDAKVCVKGDGLDGHGDHAESQEDYRLCYLVPTIIRARRLARGRRSFIEACPGAGSTRGS